jgi:hypothetical protein
MKKIALHVALGITSILMCWNTPTLAESPFAKSFAGRTADADMTSIRPVVQQVAEKAATAGSTSEESQQRPVASADNAGRVSADLPSVVFAGRNVDILGARKVAAVDFLADRSAMECIAQSDAWAHDAGAHWSLGDVSGFAIERTVLVGWRLPTMDTWGLVETAGLSTDYNRSSGYLADDHLSALAVATPVTVAR